LEQCEVEVGAYLVADPESFELVEPGEGPLDDPTGLAQSGTMSGAFAGDLRFDAAGPEQPTVSDTGSGDRLTCPTSEVPVPVAS
jgi:hypothetical protein